MKPPRIGSLRHRVVLEAETRTPDGGGGASLGWTPVAELWAAIEPLTGNESIIAEALRAHVSHVLVIRSRPGVAPAMRFRFGARLFDITAVLDIGERRRFLACSCRDRDL